MATQAHCFLADLSSPTTDSTVSLWLTKHGFFKLAFLIFSVDLLLWRGCFPKACCMQAVQHCHGPVDGLGLICAGKQLQNQPGHEFIIL